MKGKEQKESAIHFFETWANRGSEKSDSQTFWRDLLTDVLGMTDITNRVQFEKPVIVDSQTKFIDVFIPESRVLIEQKSLGIDLSKGIQQSGGIELSPYKQAKRYADNLPFDEKPRWIVVSNFSEIRIHDMNARNPEKDYESITLQELPKEIHRLSFLVEEKEKIVSREIEISIKAGEIVGLIYDALLAQYADKTNPESLISLNKLCVRLVFCMYAEDSGLFGNRLMFHDYMEQYAAKDWRKALIDLFKILDTKIENRDPYLEEDLLAFPYVNGGLFAEESIEIPRITDDIRKLILENGCGFDWSEISPTIFGAVFESTLNPDTRRKGGMHYTSIENIHKVIDPLFFNVLTQELEQIKKNPVAKRKTESLKFQEKLANLTFLDPACGSGNFLTESYISLRKLENEAIMLRTDGKIVMGEILDPIKVSIHQFYGIEINDFAVTVAKTALWIAEHQMMKETESLVSMNLGFLPLHSYANIVEGNALRMDWNIIGDEPSRFVKEENEIGDEPSRFVKKENKIEEKASRFVKKDINNEYIYTHGNLPHWHKDGALQFITFRLADSLPQEKLLEMKEQKELWLKKHPEPWNERETIEYNETFTGLFDKWLKSNYGSCILQNPEVKSIVDNAIDFFNGVKYLVHDYVIMPNHLHILIEPLENNILTEIMHSLKSFTAHKINQVLGKNGEVWQHESFDRMIRNENHYIKVREYIERNRLEAEALLGAEASTGDEPSRFVKCNSSKRSEDASSPKNALTPKFDYIIGNPPFVGYSLQNTSQKGDILSIYVDENGKPYKTAGKIDYVAGWYFKASQFIQNTNTKCCFVSTNSITQGEQVASVFKPLFERFGIQIDFSYRTFRWDSESTLKAHVHCVIIGFSYKDELSLGDEPSRFVNNHSSTNLKYIYDGENIIEAKNINPYLIDAPNIFVESRSKSICDVPQMSTGNRPADGGHLIIEAEEYDEFIKKEPNAVKYIKKLTGAEEYINNKKRYCLWLVGANPKELLQMPLVLERIEACKKDRLAGAEDRQKLAATPHLFREQINPENYVLVPSTSSERRKYIPMGFFDCNVISTNANLIIPNATLYHFGILTSSVHMAWMRVVCGRLKSDYRYSKDIVYNNFVWPLINKRSEDTSSPILTNRDGSSPKDASSPIAKITQTAQAILDARAKYPDCSLADLYGENMYLFPELVKAHIANDNAVKEAYGFAKNITESEIVAELFKLYEAKVKGE